MWVQPGIISAVVSLAALLLQLTDKLMDGLLHCVGCQHAFFSVSHSDLLRALHTNLLFQNFGHNNARIFMFFFFMFFVDFGSRKNEKFQILNGDKRSN